MGTATSAVTFFRSIGSSFGASLFGAILVARFSAHLADIAPSAASLGSAATAGGLNALASLPPAISHLAFEALTDAFSDLFFYATPFMLAALAIAFFLKEMPLRGEVKQQAEYEPVGM